MSDSVHELISIFSHLRVGIILDEYDLQSRIADMLKKHNISYQKEYRLGSKSRVDFLTEHGIAIEVKKSKPNRTKLIEQINRYGGFEEVKAIIVIVETSLKVPIEKTKNGKPCIVFGLRKLWGIAI